MFIFCHLGAKHSFSQNNKVYVLVQGVSEGSSMFDLSDRLTLFLIDDFIMKHTPVVLWLISAINSDGLHKQDHVVVHFFGLPHPRHA